MPSHLLVSLDPETLGDWATPVLEFRYESIISTDYGAVNYVGLGTTVMQATDILIRRQEVPWHVQELEELDGQEESPIELEESLFNAVGKRFERVCPRAPCQLEFDKTNARVPLSVTAQ